MSKINPQITKQPITNEKTKGVDHHLGSHLSTEIKSVFSSSTKAKTFCALSLITLLATLIAAFVLLPLGVVSSFAPVVLALVGSALFIMAVVTAALYVKNNFPVEDDNKSTNRSNDMKTKKNKTNEGNNNSDRQRLKSNNNRENDKNKGEDDNRNQSKKINFN